MAKEAKSNFIGVRLTDEEMAILESVMEAMSPLTGKHSQSDALRYIIRNFKLAASPLGKEFALAA